MNHTYWHCRQNGRADHFSDFDEVLQIWMMCPISRIENQESTIDFSSSEFIARDRVEILGGNNRLWELLQCLSALKTDVFEPRAW